MLITLKAAALGISALGFLGVGGTVPAAHAQMPVTVGLTQVAPAGHLRHDLRHFEHKGENALKHHHHLRRHLL